MAEQAGPSTDELRAKLAEVRERKREIDGRLTEIRVARQAAIQAREEAGDLLGPLPSLEEPPTWAVDERHLTELKDGLERRETALHAALMEARREEHTARILELRPVGRELTVKLQALVAKMHPILVELAELESELRQVGGRSVDGPPMDLFRLLLDERGVRLWLESERLAVAEERRREQERLDKAGPRLASERAAAQRIERAALFGVNPKVYQRRSSRH